MKYREVTRRLRALGCTEIPRRGSGSHRKWINPMKERGAVVPDWGPKELKTGTLHALVRQLGLEWHEFEQA